MKKISFLIIFSGLILTPSLLLGATTPGTLDFAGKGPAGLIGLGECRLGVTRAELQNDYWNAGGESVGIIDISGPKGGRFMFDPKTSILKPQGKIAGILDLAIIMNDQVIGKYIPKPQKCLVPLYEMMTGSKSTVTEVTVKGVIVEMGVASGSATTAGTEPSDSEEGGITKNGPDGKPLVEPPLPTTPTGIDPKATDVTAPGDKLAATDATTKGAISQEEAVSEASQPVAGETSKPIEVPGGDENVKKIQKHLNNEAKAGRLRIDTKNPNGLLTIDGKKGGETTGAIKAYQAANANETYKLAGLSQPNGVWGKYTDKAAGDLLGGPLGSTSNPGAVSGGGGSVAGGGTSLSNADLQKSYAEKIRTGGALTQEEVKNFLTSNGIRVKTNEAGKVTAVLAGVRPAVLERLAATRRRFGRPFTVTDMTGNGHSSTGQHPQKKAVDIRTSDINELVLARDLKASGFTFVLDEGDHLHADIR